jgi:hypothetical protein
MKKNPGNLQATCSIQTMPTVQISLGIVVLFEKIYDGEPILTIFSVIGEDVKYREISVIFENCDSVTLPDIDAVFGTMNYCFQTIETGSAEYFWPLS